MVVELLGRLGLGLGLEMSELTPIKVYIKLGLGLKAVRHKMLRLDEDIYLTFFIYKNRYGATGT